jgi:hypothetical protein
MGGKRRSGGSLGGLVLSKAQHEGGVTNSNTQRDADRPKRGRAGALGELERTKEKRCGVLQHFI